MPNPHGCVGQVFSKVVLERVNSVVTQLFTDFQAVSRLGGQRAARTGARAVTVHPKGAEMSTYPSIPATVEVKRGRLPGVVVRIAALTAAVTWALSAYAFDSGGSTTTATTAPAIQGYMSYPGPHPTTATDSPLAHRYMSYLGPRT